MKLQDHLHAVPLVGQAFHVDSFTITALIVCHCDAHKPLNLIMGVALSCPACQRVFAFDGFRMIDDVPQFSIQVIDAGPKKSNGEERRQ